MYIHISRTVIESFKDAYQLFADVWSPIAESCLNLGCSILFGYLWGLNGVLMGVNLSLIIIILLWKPYYTFRHGLKSPVLPYYMQYAFHTGVLIVGALVAKWMMAQFQYEHSDLITLVFVLLLGMTVFIIITYAILMLSTKGMRMFTIRIKNILLRRI